MGRAERRIAAEGKRNKVKTEMIEAMRLFIAHPDRMEKGETPLQAAEGSVRAGYKAQDNAVVDQAIREFKSSDACAEILQQAEKADKQVEVPV